MKQNYQKIIDDLKNLQTISVNNCFSYAKFTADLIRSDDKEKNDWGRNIVVHVLDNIEKIPENLKTLWADLIEACGFYPYIEKEQSRIPLIGLSECIRKELHQSKSLNGKYLHEEQLRALNIFDSGKNLVISAPTSFGKSLLIEELVARKTSKNIIIVQPTLALLDETRKNLKKYSDYYKIIIKTSQKYNESGNNIFLLTAERVIEYPEFPPIDILVIDEFYKLSTNRKDERADILNIAFYRILKQFNPHFYLLGPNIDEVSGEFLEKFNAEFYKTNYSLVSADIINLFEEYKDKLSKPKLNKEYIEDLLFKTLSGLKDEQTLIYCSSPERTRELSRKFLEYAKKNDILNKQDLPLIQWAKDHIHSEWSLCKCLELGIGVHDAALPRHLSASIIHQFNRSKIQFLFCTSTIIEGVNTNAKNVILFDKKRGKNPIDYFDYSNIKGRAGRLMVHYVGRIFNFHEVPRLEKVEINFPFFDQDEKTSQEILIQLQQEDIKNKEIDNYKEIEDLPEEEYFLFRNNGVSVSGQRKILQQYASDLKTNQDLITWTGYPTYEQLLYALNLASSNLKKPSESMGFNNNKVAFLVNSYAGNPEIMHLVANEFRYLLKNNKYNKTKNELLDDAVRIIFQFQRHWLDYTLPKWFHVLNSLQEFACVKDGIKPGNYTYYASSLENDFIDPKFTFLSEMGLPRSAISKIESQLPAKVENESEIIDFIRKSVQKINFTEYEIEKINEL